MDIAGKIYTTEELSAILNKEFNACMEGERTYPLPDNAEEIARKTMIGAILGAQNMFQMGCYHEFRDQVQKYQLENNISGLEIREYLLAGKTYRFPSPIHQLELTKDDYQVLKLAKDAIVDAFLAWCNELTYISFSYSEKAGGEFDIETTSRYIKHHADICDWAEICMAKEFEIGIQLGYGDYHLAPYTTDHSPSGKYSDSIYFYATRACENYLPKS